MRRRVALEAALRLTASAEPAPACAAPLLRNPTPSSTRICELASACGLIAAADACLPAAPIDGPVTRRAIRRTLDLLSGR